MLSSSYPFFDRDFCPPVLWRVSGSTKSLKLMRARSGVTCRDPIFNLHWTILSTHAIAITTFQQHLPTSRMASDVVAIDVLASCLAKLAPPFAADGLSSSA
jgi:hypothetical protein